jgi:hypothetical protein
MDPIETILASASSAGVYVDEDPEQFEAWIAQTSKILDNSGPRCDVCDALSSDEAATQSLINLGFDGDFLRPPFCFRGIDEVSCKYRFPTHQRKAPPITVFFVLVFRSPLRH